MSHSISHVSSMLKRFHIKRTLLLLAVHVGVFVLAYYMAFQLRYDFAVSTDSWSLMWATMPWMIAVKLVVFGSLRSFHGWWKYVTFADLANLLRSCTLATLALAAISFLAYRWQISVAILVLDWGGSLFALGGIRSAWRMGQEHLWSPFSGNVKRPVLVVGADCGGEALCRQIHGDSRLDYRIVGFLDDNHARHGSRLGGIPFLGGLLEVIEIARRYAVQDVLVMTSSISGQRLRDLLRQCDEAQVRVRMIPAIEKLLNGSDLRQIRNVDIGDLLRREPVNLDSEAIEKMLHGRRVLVTGAGGSIGSEICRLIARHRPERLILVERAENNLFQIEQELRREASDVVCHACVADVCDEERLLALFRQHRPQIVFHAAAHKHVPLMEQNAGEAIKNNVFGTSNLADVADAFEVERFVMISTDKAVKPASIMGASKELAERYVQAMSEVSTTSFVVVRFGNVLGSAGSVVPIFQEQIRRGGPVTITHPEMRRFFMTIPEAAQLVLQAAALGHGGETFVLDMGKPVKIVDLATDLIRLSGFSSDEIDTQIVGPRPGEKLYEEVFHDDEPTSATKNPKLRVARHCRWPMAEVRSWLAELAPLLNASDEVIRSKLAQLAPGCKSASEPVAAASCVTASDNGNGAEKSHTNGNGDGHGNGNGKTTLVCDVRALSKDNGNGNGNADGNGNGQKIAQSGGLGRSNGSGQDQDNGMFGGKNGESGKSP